MYSVESTYSVQNREDSVECVLRTTLYAVHTLYIQDNHLRRTRQQSAVLWPFPCVLFLYILYKAMLTRIQSPLRAPYVSSEQPKAELTLTGRQTRVGGVERKGNINSTRFDLMGEACTLALVHQSVPRSASQS